MSGPASDVYAIVLDEIGGQKNWSRGPFAMVRGLISMARGSTGQDSAGSGAVVISVIRTDDGEELFRHVEEMGDDEDHLLAHIQRDLASMTAEEFNTRWID